MPHSIAVSKRQAIRRDRLGITCNVRRRAPNPLRRDPTRTLMLRKRFQSALAKRFNRLKGKVIDLIVKEDALGLMTRNVTNQRWAFRTDAEKLREFTLWLEEQFGGLLGAGIGESELLDLYIAEGWRTGAGRVFEDVKAKGRYSRWGPGEGDFYRGSKAQFLETSFGLPVSKERVKLLASRTYTDLKGVTDQMSTKMARVLTDGLVQGKSPREVARDLNREIETGRVSSLRVARTETIRAHAEGQLDAMELLGVEEVGVAVEWSTSGLGETALGNPSPCPLCAPLQGMVMSVSEARGLLPRHSNCMCSYIPANVGEDTEEQKRTKTQIGKAVDSSLRAEAPSKRTLAEQRSRTTWAGADKTFSKRRPQELVPTEEE